MAAILKVSVLVDGSMLLDGAPVTVEGLGRAMDTAGEGAVVWYYRENAAGEAPPAAVEVMKLITARRLPVRLSTKADFSDAVGASAAAVSQVFAAIRQRASERQLVILCPDGRVISMRAPARETAPADEVAAVERLLPSAKPRKVAVIADTSWTAAATVQSAGRAIPFFGLLMGLAAIGHAVWVFDGSAGAAGCAEADIAIVDSARAASLPKGWQGMAPAVRVFDRETRQLRKA